MKKTEFEYSYIKKHIRKCSECKTALGSQSIYPVDSINGVLEIYVECKKCRSSSLIYVVESDGSWVTRIIEMPTDMKKKDIIRLRKTSPITEDEVLDLHNLLS